MELKNCLGAVMVICPQSGLFSKIYPKWILCGDVFDTTANLPAAGVILNESMFFASENNST